MKKILAVLLALMLTLTLSGCQSEAAKNVDRLIAEIGEVTLDSETQIALAEEELDALEEEDAAQVKNAEKLREARATYEDLVLQAEADEVERSINAIGTVTLEENSKKLIEAARKQYDKATEGAKAKVTNYNTLTAAENTLVQLSVEHKIDAIGTVTLSSQWGIKQARSAYDAAPKGIQVGVRNYETLEKAEARLSELQIEKAKGLIDAIGEVTLESGSAIQEARMAYNGLPDELKRKVDETPLKNAEATLAAMQAEARRIEREEKEAALAKALGALTSKKDAITGMTQYKSSQEPKYMNSRCNILPNIIMTTNKYGMLYVRYNYAGDEWVFFEKVIIKTDDYLYTRYFNYSDIKRDHAGGMVGEIALEAADEDDIEMLEDIANSQTTIVRFAGDDRTRDFTVSASDKKGIRAVLDVYHLMKDLDYVI